MKTEIKQLLRDLRAATMLGNPEAVDIALDGLLELPGVSSNAKMSTGFITQVVIPVGEVLSSIKSPLLRPLLAHPLAVGRAIGGVALAHRYLKQGDSTQKDLHQSGNDTRSDVRLALGRSLHSLAKIDPDATISLGTTWIKGSSPRLRYTALIFLPALAEKDETEILALLDIANTDPNLEVRAALVDALSDLAKSGYAGSVLSLLSRWSSGSEPDSWLICRVLSSSWAKNNATEVKSILKETKAKTGESSQITGALKALKRHGLDIDI
jgi:HEAT repeat protein